MLSVSSEGDLHVFQKCLFYLIFFLELNFSFLIPGFAVRTDSLPIEGGWSFPGENQREEQESWRQEHKQWHTNLSPGSRADKVWILDLLAEWPFLARPVIWSLFLFQTYKTEWCLHLIHRMVRRTEELRYLKTWRQSLAHSLTAKWTKFLFIVKDYLVLTWVCNWRTCLHGHARQQLRDSCSLLGASVNVELGTTHQREAYTEELVAASAPEAPLQRTQPTTGDCNFSPWEAEARGFQVQGLPKIHVKTMSQKGKRNGKKMCSYYQETRTGLLSCLP